MTSKRSPALSVTLFKSLPFERHSLQALFHQVSVEYLTALNFNFNSKWHNSLLLKA